MSSPVIRAGKSAFERIRDAVLKRDDPDKNKDPTGPGTPTPG